MKKILLFAFVLFTFITAKAQCDDLFFSEYVEGSSQNKALEIYNPTDEAIDLSDYIIRRYRNGAASFDNELDLVGTIAAGDVFIITNGQITANQYGAVDTVLYEMADMHGTGNHDDSPMYFNGNDALTLEKKNGQIVDIFAHIGPPDSENGWGDLTDTTITYNSGGVPTEYTIVDYAVGPLFWLSWTEDHTLIRKFSVQQGVTQNPTPFNVAMEWDSIPEDTWDSLGFHRCDCRPFGIADIKQSHNVYFFPNPVSSGVFTVKSEEFISELSIMNLNGQELKSYVMDDNTASVDVNIPSLVKGVYILRLRFADQSLAHRKFIIE